MARCQVAADPRPGHGHWLHTGADIALFGQHNILSLPTAPVSLIKLINLMAFGDKHPGTTYRACGGCPAGLVKSRQQRLELVVHKVLANQTNQLLP
jgi:hypothetical protein